MGANVDVLKREALLFQINQRCFDYIEEFMEENQKGHYFNAFKSQITDILEGSEEPLNNLRLYSIIDQGFKKTLEFEFYKSPAYTIENSHYKSMWWLTDVFITDKGSPEFGVDINCNMDDKGYLRVNYYLKFKELKWLKNTTPEKELERLKAE
jgi:hypothetical protein